MVPYFENKILVNKKIGRKIISMEKYNRDISHLIFWENIRYDHKFDEIFD